jgi:hypothetical protein
MKRSILIILCLLALQARAQQHDTARKYDISKRIFIEPFALIDVYNSSSLRIGVEWPVVKDFCSIYCVWGQYLYQASAEFGVYARAGVKLYPYTLFRKQPPYKPMYISLQFFYKSQSFSVLDNIEIANNKPGPDVTYDVRKKSMGVHLEMGEVIAYKRLCLEPYFGVGVRLSTVVNSVSDSFFHQLYDIQEGFVNGIGNATKTNELLPSMTLGVRLSYLFKTKAGASGASKDSFIKRKLMRL